MTDPTVRTERLELRLTPDDLAVLDSRRGPLTRSAWLRVAIHSTPENQWPTLPESSEEVLPPMALDNFPATPVEPPAGPDHRHNFTDDGITRPYRRGRLTLTERHQTCDCGLDRWQR